MDEILVYAWLDPNKGITRLESSIFYTGSEYSVVLDKGRGDKYAHCQSGYLGDCIVDNDGNPNFKYVEGKGAVKLTDEEKAKLYPKTPTIEEPAIDEEDILSQLMVENAQLSKRVSEQDDLIADIMGQVAELTKKEEK